MKAQVTLQRILRERLEGLRGKNPSFSIRAFSRRTGISPASLSLILNGKRKVSKKLADAISKKLLLDPIERAELLNQFSSEKSPSDVCGLTALQLTADQYEIVGDWKAFAILGLAEIPGFQNDPFWIAERLGIPVVEITRTLERLKRLEMVAVDANGGLRRTKSRYRTTDDVTNLSLRKSHYQNLELAKESLDRDPIENRDFSWITFPLNLDQMKEAKALIRKFQNDLFEVMSRDSNPSEVYRLCVHFFPLTKTNRR